MVQANQVIANLQDSLLGWASQTELELSQRLQDVELVVDLGYSSDELERLECFYGIFLHRQLQAGSNISALFGVSPALTLVALTARARNVVDPAQFATEVHTSLGLPEDADVATAIAEVVPKAVAQFSLLQADDALSTVLMHAGLINAEVPAFLEYLDELQPSMPPVFAAFQAAQPDAAARVLQQVTTVRDWSQEHPTSWLDRYRSDIRGAVQEAVALELRERPVGTAERDAAVGVASRELRPRVVLDRLRNKLCVRLPEQAVAAPRYEVHWRVHLEGTTKMYRTGLAWGDESGYAQALDISLDSPVREVTVMDVTHNLTWVIPVVDSSDPMLVFTQNGTDVSDKRSLHHQILHVVVPATQPLQDPVRECGIEPLSTTHIAGWEGWVCHEIDARQITSLSSGGQMRSVDHRQRVRFRHPSAPVPYFHSLAGLPLHVDSLIAEFPPTPSGQTETWALSISAFGGAGNVGEEVAPPEPLEIPAAGGAFPVFDPEMYDAPWVGEYLVRLRGPRGESFRHEYAIVEGAQANIAIHGGSQAFRIPSGGGLSEVTVRLRATAKHFDTDPVEAVVRGHEASTHLVVSSEEGDQLPLQFTPPRLTFELPMVAHPPMWRASRFKVRPRDVDMQGVLRIRGAGELADAKLSVRNQHGAPIKTVRLEAIDRSFTYAVAMEKLAGSGAMLPSGRLDLEWTDTVSQRRISVALADIQSAEDVAVALDGDTLALTSAFEQPMGMWIWATTAPWNPATAVTVVDGRAQLPSDLQQAGPLLVQPFATDAFSTVITPVVPPASAALVAQEGYVRSENAALDALSALLAGDAETVPEDPIVMPLLWEMLVSGSAGEAAVKAVRQVLRAHPEAALTGLADSLVPIEQQPGRVVEAGLVRSRFGAGQNFSQPWIATMAALGSLDELLSGQEQLDAEQKAQRKQLVETLQEYAGNNVLQILRTGRDDTLDSACIDRSTVAIAQMDTAQQEALLEMFFAQANIVPGAIMDDGSRLLAVFETFNKREELVSLLSEEGLIQAAVTMLRTLRSTDKSLYNLARIRFDKLDGVDTNAKENIWALTPVVSLVFALVARLHAHGLISSNKTLDNATPGWATMADLVPDLVTSDLIAAEAIILAMTKPEVGAGL